MLQSCQVVIQASTRLCHIILHIHVTGEYASEQEILGRHFSALVGVLSSCNLYADFVSKKVITLTDYTELSSYTNSREKAEQFLSTKLFPPVEAGFTTAFYIMLNIMKNHGNIAVKEISAQIIKSLPPNCKQVVYMYFIASIVLYVNTIYQVILSYF